MKRALLLLLLVACGDQANVVEPCFEMTRYLTIAHEQCSFGHPLHSADVFAIEGATCPGPNGEDSSCDRTFGIECEPDFEHCEMFPKVDFTTDPVMSPDTETFEGVRGLAIVGFSFDNRLGTSCTFVPCDEL